MALFTPRCYTTISSLFIMILLSHISCLSVGHIGYISLLFSYWNIHDLQILFFHPFKSIWNFLSDKNWNFPPCNVFKNVNFVKEIWFFHTIFIDYEKKTMWIFFIQQCCYHSMGPDAKKGLNTSDKFWKNDWYNDVWYLYKIETLKRLSQKILE